MVLRSVVGALVLMGMVACGGSDSEGAAPAPVAPLPASSVLDIALAHNALVFDSSRGVYYASVPGSAVGAGHTIARIDMTTGEVTYSRVVGAEPGPLALSRDGSVLYVGASGSGEVLKLGLPNFEEQWRVQLPAPQFSGQLSAEHLTVKPDDADTVAVSMRNTGISPRHEGVALIRGGTLLPRRTQTRMGANLIAFGSDANFVYGFNNETSEFGLRRIAVAADGLSEEAVVQSGGTNFGIRALDVVGSRLVFDAQVYAAPGLTLVGFASGVGGCRHAAQSNRLLCFGGSSGVDGDGTIAVVDAVTLHKIATTSFRTNAADRTPFAEIVPGPSGQVALRDAAFLYDTTATSIRLVSNAALP